MAESGEIRSIENWNLFGISANPNRKRKRLTTKEEDHDAASMAAMNAMMGGGWGNFNLGADEEDKVDSIAQDSKGERPNEKTDLSDWDCLIQYDH